MFGGSHKPTGPPSSQGAISIPALRSQGCRKGRHSAPGIGDTINLSLKAKRNLRKLGISDEEHENFIRKQAALHAVTEASQKHNKK